MMKSVPLAALKRKRKALAVVQFFFFSGQSALLPLPLSLSLSPRLASHRQHHSIADGLCDSFPSRLAK